jgi:hypothetical protein
MSISHVNWCERKQANEGQLFPERISEEYVYSKGRLIIRCSEITS